tara:strand:- start:1058 stop:1267 length:210 start_codon:yes stop_codon:yes gene_type:complete
MGLIDHLERKVIKAIRKQTDPKAEYSREIYYHTALTYCDCIRHFTEDTDKYECYDRLRQIAKNRKPAFS